MHGGNRNQSTTTTLQRKEEQNTHWTELVEVLGDVVELVDRNVRGSLVLRNGEGHVDDLRRIVVNDVILGEPSATKDGGWTGAVADGWTGAIAEVDGTLGAADGEEVSWKRNKGREEDYCRLVLHQEVQHALYKRRHRIDSGQNINTQIGKMK